MEATKQQIANIFNGHRILEVPFYQRGYVWQKDQWIRFLEDMEFITHCQQDYFLGSVILKQTPSDLNDPNDHRMIIDGQQRFTTLAIFFKVLCMKTDDMETFNQNFVVKNKKLKTRRFAINHSLNDRKDFELVLSLEEDVPVEESTPSNIIQAYNFFQENIDPEKLDIEVVITHITFIGIELQQQDDEQVIFDTINSLGVRLTTGELLKNYFFNEGAKDEYEEIWMPIFEKDRDVSNYWDQQITLGRLKKSNIDAFFSAYLSIKIQDPAIGVDYEHKSRYRRADALFSNYKDLIRTYNLDKQDLLWEVMEYATLYYENINPNISDTELPGKSSIERINFLIFKLDCSTLLPYVLFVLRNTKSQKEQDEIFGYLESYVVRRGICKCNNNNYSDLFGMSLISNNVLTFEGLKDYIENKETSFALALPSDNMVCEALQTETFPNNKALPILYLMESGLRKDKPHATKLYPYEEYSLEHIMPKKWKNNWPLGSNYDEETRDKYVNSLGNMTLLPLKLNTSISNAPWNEKKQGKGDKEGLVQYASGLVSVKDFLNENDWTEDTIIKRANWMATVVKEIWPSYLPDSDGDSVDGPNDLTQTKDTTRYSFDNEEFFSKSEFVFRLVKRYVEENPNTTYTNLKKLFSDDMCATGYKFIGFLCTEQEYLNWDNKNKERRYLPNKPERKLTSADGVVFLVNTQWNKKAMPRLVRFAKKQGWNVITNK